MSIQNLFRVVCILGAFSALGCAATTPQVSAAAAGSAQTLAYASPASFSTKASACNFAVQKARRQAANSCSVTALTVDRAQCECSRTGAKHACEVEAVFTCQ